MSKVVDTLWFDKKCRVLSPSTLSISEAYDFIEKIKKEVSKITSYMQ